MDWFPPLTVIDANYFTLDSMSEPSMLYLAQLVFTPSSTPPWFHPNSISPSLNATNLALSHSKTDAFKLI